MIEEQPNPCPLCLGVFWALCITVSVAAIVWIGYTVTTWH